MPRSSGLACASEKMRAFARSSDSRSAVAMSVVAAEELRFHGLSGETGSGRSAAMAAHAIGHDQQPAARVALSLF
jgi:hypothetical protein